MSLPLDVFKFPNEWKGDINLSETSFLPYQCAYQACKNYAEVGSDVILCTCHKRCQTHCAVARSSQNTFIPPCWSYLLQPYLNVPVCNPWNERVMADCASKLNGFDNNGLGALHRLLEHTDDARLLRKFLELGVDPEARYVRYKQAPKLYLTEFLQGGDVDGGSALHFAAYFERKECLKSLLEVGVNLDARTTDGDLADDMGEDEDIWAMIKKARSEDTRKSLAQLAKEGKFFAVRHRIRAGRITPADLKSMTDGRTASEWCLAILLGKHTIPAQTIFEASDCKVQASQTLLEMNYRFGEDGRVYGASQFTMSQQDLANPAILGPSGSASAAADFEDLRKQQELILEALHGLTGPI